ncbi:hypothetical protein AX16_003389 [Volvariella volvacea WC 439]|nr:hypothetical protein AX16_003389 [Volvariella volvacea WC 439]
MSQPQLGIHRGAIDQTTITTRPPLEVMKRVNETLHSMGISFREESHYKYRCIRPRNKTITVLPKRSIASLRMPVPSVVLNLADEAPSDNSDSHDEDEDTFIPITNANPLYGNLNEDPADEVLFSVELTRLEGLHGTYSLDIRRLKGNLRSYKFLYDTFRSRADLRC